MRLRTAGFSLHSACGALCAWFALTAFAGAAHAQAKLSPHLTMGNPSAARPMVHGATDPDNFLIVHDEYCLSWNQRTGLANWVSWRLAREDFSPGAERDDAFRTDPDAPPSLHGSAVALWANSGFDKGHVCPNGDKNRKKSAAAVTYYTTNMLPQAPKVNRGPWKDHEAFRRELAGDGKELYIVAGPAGCGGQGEHGWSLQLPLERLTELRREIHEHGQAAPVPFSKRGCEVPAACWAVCLVLDDEEGDDVQRVSKKTPHYAVVMPNIQAIDPDWKKYQTTIGEVQRLTGLDFFDLVDDQIERALEGQP